MINRLKQAYWASRKRHWGMVATILLPLGRWGEVLISKAYWKSSFGFSPNVRHPKRFSEHLLSIMLSDDGHSVERSLVSDKELVKIFVANRVGPDATAKTVGVLKSKGEVETYPFPETCVIKATHDSGSVVIRRKGEALDIEKIKGWFDFNYYWSSLEPNYKSLKPKVIVEELLQDLVGDIPRDYKVFCFRAIPKFIQVDADRFTQHSRSFFSTEWDELAFLVDHPRSKYPLLEPPLLKRMLDMAAKLSAGFSFIRIDFFLLEDRVLVGEMTNFPDATKMHFSPDSSDLKAGRLFEDPTLDVKQLLGVRQDH